jgi:hypothetical protein
MAMRWLVCALAVGCAGDDGDRVIPVYDEGILLEGDCEDVEYVATDVFGMTELYEFQLGYEPLIQIDDNLPGEAGTILGTQLKFDELLTELNFSPDSRPLVDFDEEQVGAVWYQTKKSCGIEIEGAHLRTKPDGTVVFDVELLDIRKNCPDNCDLPSQALVIDAFSNEFEATTCRRIRPGCPPSGS